MKLRYCLAAALSLAASTAFAIPPEAPLAASAKEAAADTAADTAAVAAAEGDYSLESYLRKVESDNRDLKLAREDLLQAEQSVVQARSALLPTVAAQYSYTRNLVDVMQTSPVASQAGGGQLIYQDVDSNFDNESTIGLGVNQKLFDAQAIASYSQARKAREVRVAALETTRRSIRTAAKKLYAQAQLTKAVLEVMETSEKAAAENYRSVSLKAQAGVSTELDALLAEVDWKEKIPSVAEARKNNELVLIAFKNLAGIPLSQAISLSEDQGSLPPMPEPVALQSVLAKRSDYRISLLSMDLADIAVKAAYGTFLPTVSGSFSWGYVSYSGMEGGATYDTDSSSVGISVSLPLFTGFYRTSLMKSAQIAQRQASLDLSKKAEEIEQELADLRLRLEEAKTRIDSAAALETAAKRASLLAKTSFDNGLGTQLQVTDASSKYDQARLSLRNAIYTYRAACYDWDYATGASD